MSIIEEYLKSAGGNWLNAENVHDGYKLKIQEVWLDDDTFERPYICVSGVNNQGEAVKARLGVQNVQRIVDVLGTQQTSWVDNFLECIGTQNYPGLGKRGVLWRGIKAAA